MGREIPILTTPVQHRYDEQDRVLAVMAEMALILWPLGAVSMLLMMSLPARPPWLFITLPLHLALTLPGALVLTAGMAASLGIVHCLRARIRNSGQRTMALWLVVVGEMMLCGTLLQMYVVFAQF